MTLIEELRHANGSAEWHRQERGIKTPEQVRIEQLEECIGGTKRDLMHKLDQRRDKAKRLQHKLDDLEAELAECKRDAESLANELQNASEVFSRYQQLNLLKFTEEATDKAAINGRYAQRANAVLAAYKARATGKCYIDSAIAAQKGEGK